MNPVMRKVDLPFLDEKGQIIEGEKLEQAKKLRLLQAGGHDVPEELQEYSIKHSFYKCLDTASVLKALVCKAKNPNIGMGFEEIEQTRSYVEKIDNANLGGNILLSTNHYKELCEKVKQPFLKEYNLAFDVFLQTVLTAPEVPLVPAVEGEK